MNIYFFFFCQTWKTFLAGFEKFRKIVTEKDYDIIALPEGVIAPTDNKDDVAIPHYSLVEKRRNSGEGVVLYIKDSLRYKVVDLAAENTEGHPTMEDLVAKLEKNGNLSYVTSSFLSWCFIISSSDNSHQCTIWTISLVLF